MLYICKYFRAYLRSLLQLLTENEYDGILLFMDAELIFFGRIQVLLEGALFDVPGPSQIILLLFILNIYSMVRKFHSRSNMRAHVDTVHFKKKNIPCEMCGKMFYNASLLKTHQESLSYHRLLIYAMLSKVPD